MTNPFQKIKEISHDIGKYCQNYKAKQSQHRSLLRQKDRLISALAIQFRASGDSLELCKWKAKAHKQIAELDEAIDKVDLEEGQGFAEYEKAKYFADLFRTVEVSERIEKQYLR